MVVITDEHIWNALIDDWKKKLKIIKDPKDGRD